MPLSFGERWWLCLFALGVWVILLVRFFIGAQLAAADGQCYVVGVLESLGYFTVLTCLLIGLVLTAASGLLTARLLHPLWVSTAVTSVILVALVYALVLRQLWHPQGLRYWVDIGLHYVIPPLFVLAWWRLVPPGAIGWRSPLVWLWFPLLYLVVILGWGQLSGFYPYPFLQMEELGAMRVLRNSLVLVGLYLLIGYCLVAINHCRSGHKLER